MSLPYHIIPPKGTPVPIILSVPHSGVDFPSEIQSHYVKEKMESPDDTDWFVHDLYNFASDIGITIIRAKYSRWVIDLNRDPESAPLYTDGRIITGLTPSTDFFGEAIYKSPEMEPSSDEVNRRLNTYYWPYYEKVQELLDARIAEFGKVLLWDAHSIRHFVPTIRKDVFPDMILGNNDETTAHPELIKTAMDKLQEGSFQINHNTPFKGGHITRYFGNPAKNIHALQLEMNKVLYMNDEELEFDETRANKVRSILQPTFEALIQTVNSL